MRDRERFGLAFAALIASSGVAAWADWPTFEVIGKPAGWSRAQFNAMNADGTVLVGEGRSPLGDEALVWRVGSGFEVAGDLPGASVEGKFLAVSGDGQVPVGSGRTIEGLDPVTEAMSWTSAGGLVPLGRFGGFTIAKAASNDGSVIVGAGSPDSGGVEYAFRWEEGIGITRPLDLIGQYLRGTANAVSGDGSIVVGRDTSSTSTSQGKAFIWLEGNAHIELLPLPDESSGTTWNPERSSANWISQDGTVILGTGDPYISAVQVGPLIWIDGEVSALEIYPGSTHTSAGSASADLRVIAGSTTLPGSTTHAVIWLDGSIMRLRDYFVAQGVPFGPDDGRLFEGVSVSDDGQRFLGTGLYQGNSVYWLAYVPLPPPPCPADVNGDTNDDVLDFLDYMDAFGQCEMLPGPCVPAGSVVDADFNGDTTVDVVDFLDFFDAFGTGCPG